MIGQQHEKAKEKHKTNNPNKQTSKAHKFWPINEKVKQVKRAHALTTWCTKL